MLIGPHDGKVSPPRDQAEPASQPLARAAGSWSWVGSSSGPGRLRMLALVQRRGCGRGAGTEPAVGDGDDDQGDAQPGPVASSTDDATGRDAGEAYSRSAAFTASAGPSRGAPPEHVEHKPLAAPDDVTVMAHPQPLHDRTRPPIVRFGERDDLSGA